MASSPITSWQLNKEIMETVSDFIFLGPKISVDGDWSHEIKRCLLLGRKAMTNLDSILKSRDITLPTKVHIVKVMIFPIVMYGCDSWTVEKAEHQRIGAFELQCWGRHPGESLGQQGNQSCYVASVMSDSVRPHRRQPTRLLHPLDFPGKSTGMGCHFLLQCIKVKSKSEVTQSCPTLSDTMDCSPPGSSVHGIFQARVLEWVAIAFSRKPKKSILKEISPECSL